MPARIRKEHTGRRLQPKPDMRSLPAHRAFVKSLPCCVCGRPPRSDPAHIRKGLPADALKGGTALKPEDKWIVPLCSRRPGFEGHHMKWHRLGDDTFWEALGVGIPIELAKTLWQVSGDLDKGLAKVREFQRRIVG